MKVIPTRIDDQHWDNDITPVVSICCITYNHENYIRDAIEGFLMQETTFPVEILIHDDASTDKTAEIIKEYEAKYPCLIKPIYQVENQYSKGVKISSTFNFPRAKGKYIAVCEGDDYWTDPLKLQKQVVFMEENPDYSVSFHAAEHLNVLYPIKNKIHIPKFKVSYDVEDIILGGGGFMTTNAMLFRIEYINDMPYWAKNAPVGDLPLMLLLALNGKIGYINEVMSCYRLFANGSWSAAYSKSIIKMLRTQLAISIMFFRFNKYTGWKYTNTILKKNVRTYGQILKIMFDAFKLKYITI